MKYNEMFRKGVVTSRDSISIYTHSQELMAVPEVHIRTSLSVELLA